MRWALMSVMLVGCATGPAQLTTSTVPVPVASPCIDVKDIPPIPKSNTSVNGTMRQDAAAAVLDAKELRTYATKADVLLHQCSTE